MTRTRTAWVLPLLVAGVAFVARLVPVVRGGGLEGLHGYDDGVYYSGAAALVFGRLPYADYVLLHPPVVVLVLAPFALLGRLTSDPLGLAVARLAFMALGALNAVLVLRIAARWGRAAGLVGGLFHALWYPAAFSERSTLLEPLVTTSMLAALLLLRVGAASQPTSDRRQLLAGVALGLGTSTKIWTVAPVLVIVGWQLLGHGRAAALRVAAGAVGAAVVVCLPFFLRDPAAMFRMVILAQIGRPDVATPTTSRLGGITSVARQLVGAPDAVLAVALGVALLLGAAVVGCCLLRPEARVIGVLVGTTSLVILLSPSYFATYVGFPAGPLAVAVAVATATVAARAGARSRPGGTVVTASVVALVAVLGARAMTFPTGERYPGRQLAAAVPARGCVVSDSGVALALLDVLSRDLERGCPLEVDFTGRTYVDARRGPGGGPLPRPRDVVWQRQALRYLTSGSATVIVRPGGDGFTAATRDTLNRLPVLAVVGGHRLLGR